MITNKNRSNKNTSKINNWQGLEIKQNFRGASLAPTGQSAIPDFRVVSRNPWVAWRSLKIFKNIFKKEVKYDFNFF